MTSAVAADTTIDYFALWQTAGAAGLYALSVLVIWFYSAFPARDWLRERIAHLKSQDGYGGKIGALLDQSDAGLNRFYKVRTSLVQAGWRLVHGVEDQHSMTMSEGEVTVALETTRDKLRLLGTEEGKAFAERIDAALAEDTVTTAHRALLRDAQIYRHNLSDSSYEDLAKLMAKAAWLSILGLAIAVVLAEVKGHELYFVLGLAGGLMSRLMRLLKEQPTPTDYGANWSSLVLSPVSGALAGWVGVALVSALASPPLSFLNQSIPDVVWDQGSHVLGLGLAFLLGFSERLFSGLVETSENQFSALITQKVPSDDKPGHRDAEPRERGGRRRGPRRRRG